jgi:hypothetical protein
MFDDSFESVVVKDGFSGVGCAFVGVRADLDAVKTIATGRGSDKRWEPLLLKQTGHGECVTLMAQRGDLQHDGGL